MPAPDAPAATSAAASAAAFALFFALPAATLSAYLRLLAGVAAYASPAALLRLAPPLAGDLKTILAAGEGGSIAGIVRAALLALPPLALTLATLAATVALLALARRASVPLQRQAWAHGATAATCVLAALAAALAAGGL
jgi:hypothetical protein